MIETELIETIKCIMIFLKIHTSEKDVGAMYGTMDKLIQKTGWSGEDIEKAKKVMKQSDEKIIEIKERRKYKI